MLSSKDDELSEEFNNFMHKVTQVSNIVHKLASHDKQVQEIGDLEAEQYLHTRDESLLQNIDEEKIQLHVKCDKTHINKSAISKEDNRNAETMSQQAFMDEISRDAEMRHKDKLIRTERMETFKKQATLAFRRGEFEKALCRYTKAIEQIKDSGILYKNRALTYINLKIYDKALTDLEWALKIDEDDLKAWLLSAKAHYLNGDNENYKKALEEAIQRNPGHVQYIQEYTSKIESSLCSESSPSNDC